MSNAAEIIDLKGKRPDGGVPPAPPVADSEGLAGRMHKRRKQLLIGLGASVAILGCAGWGYWTLVASHYVATDNAYVGASVAQINSQVSGPIAEVLVEDTTVVRKGDILATVDPSDAKL